MIMPLLQVFDCRLGYKFSKFFCGGKVCGAGGESAIIFLVGSALPPTLAKMGNTILVVEDHDDSRAMMKIMIESYGYEVIEARDGFEAVEMVKSNCPGLVLMDVNMPRLDGLSATAIIRGLENCSNLPIVAVTAFSDFRDQALEYGCVDVLRKPVEFPHLKEVIETHLA